MSMPDKIWAWEIDHNDFPSGYYSISDGYESKPYIRADLVPEWRPIEEAPRDGEICLLVHEFWRSPGACQYRYPEGWCHYADGTKVKHQSSLTHFLDLSALPLPPKEDS